MGAGRGTGEPKRKRVSMVRERMRRERELEHWIDARSQQEEATVTSEASDESTLQNNPRFVQRTRAQGERGQKERT